MFRRLLSILILIATLLTSFYVIAVHEESDLTTNQKEEFMPLKEVLKYKRVVDIGESNRGTNKNFQKNHKMFEFLVEEMGYGVLAIEADYSRCKIANDYILGIGGTLDTSVYALGTIAWETQEITDVLEFMRNYNDNPMNETKIKFYGFDMSSIYFTIVDILKDLKKFDYIRYKEYEEILLKADNFTLMSPTPNNILTIKKNILEIQSFYEKNMKKYINESSRKEFDLLVHNFDIVLQWIEFNQISQGDVAKSFNIRNKYMAENIEWILNFETHHYENDKIMLWARSSYIYKDGFIEVDGKKYEIDEFATLENNLNNLFGDEYHSIEFDFYKNHLAMAGSFIAIVLLAVICIGKRIRTRKRIENNQS